MDKRAEAFLTYLDKEGTVMGLLSGFCLAALGLVWKAIGDASADSLFDDLQGEWVSFGLLIAGSMSCWVPPSSFIFSGRCCYGSMGTFAWMDAKERRRAGV